MVCKKGITMIKQIVTTIAIVATLALANFSVSAVSASPVTPIQAKAAFELITLQSPNFVFPQEACNNPAVLSLIPAKALVGVDYDSINPSQGPVVNTTIEYAGIRTGKTTFMGTYYQTASKVGPSLISGPLNLEVKGSVVDVMVGQKLTDRVSVGLGIYPQDRMNLTIGGNLVQGSAISFRTVGGAAVSLDKSQKLLLSASYTHEGSTSEMTYAPAMTGLLVPVTFTGKYDVDTISAGAVYNPMLGTYLLAGYTSQKLRGSDIDQTVKIPSIQLTQFLSTKFAVSGKFYSKGSTKASLLYMDKGYQATVVYANNADPSLDKFIGKNSTTWFSLAKTW